MWLSKNLTFFSFSLLVLGWGVIVYKACYFPNYSFLEADVGSTLPMYGEVSWQLVKSLEGEPGKDGKPH